ncbi:MAG: DUF262 domain-containing protein [Methylocella sp.]
MSDLGSGQTTLETLFTNRAFQVPPYQRYYAWERPQLIEFIDDLDNVPESKSHFFGTFLFMRPSSMSPHTPESSGAMVGSGPYKVFDVVDGQQRLTSAVLFINAVYRAKRKLLRPMQVRNFIYDQDEAAFKFQTVPEDWPFLRTLLDPNAKVAQVVQNPSQDRLRQADEYFRNEVARRDDHDIERLIRALSECLILVHAVDGYGEASIIFETVNDRGKRLTDLEALKSFLMHVVGMTKKSDLAEKQAIVGLQENFAAVYRMINRFERNLPEDDALRQCYLTFRKTQIKAPVSYWSGDGNAKDDAKTWLKDLMREQAQEAFDASTLLAQHIQDSFQKIEAVINNAPRWEEIERLLTLRRIAGFWPILLNTYADNQQPQAEREFRCILRLCEIASLKLWGIADYRSDKAQSELIKIAQREGSNRLAVISRLKALLKSWDIPRRWQDGLRSNTFYFQGRDARYILFEYENHLRAKRGYTEIPYSDFGDMTIEHIAARRGEENVEKCLLDVSVPNALTAVEQEIDGGTKAPLDAEKVNVLHHLGNLVIDPQGPNSQKYNLSVPRKLSWFNTAPFLSQLDLEDYLIANNNVWDATVVLSRGKVLADFATRRWNEDDVGELS